MTPRKIYSDETKRTIRRMVKEEETPAKQVAELLNIPLGTVYTITSDYKPYSENQIEKELGMRGAMSNKKIRDGVMKLVNDNTTINVSQIIEKMKLRVKESTVVKWLCSVGVAFKVTRPIVAIQNCPEVKTDRKAYVTWYQSIPLDLQNTNVIFLDFSLFSLHMLRPLIRPEKRCQFKKVFLDDRVKNLSVILAVSCSKIVKCEIIFTDVNAAICNDFLKEMKESLEEGNYRLVMGNAELYKWENEFNDDCRYERMHLPKYSSFLNPCEKVFTKIKSNMRRDGSFKYDKDLNRRIMDVINSIDSRVIKRYFQNCEKFFKDCLLEHDINIK